MTLKNITYLARIAQDYGDIETELWYNKLWENIYKEYEILHNLGVENLWRKSLKSVKDKEIALRQEMDEEWIRDRRIEYLENEIKSVLKEIEELEKSKKFSGDWFLFENELAYLKKKYKSFYIEWATLKGNLEMNNGFTEDVLQRCRNVPIESLVSTIVENAGNGRKKTLCPFPEHDDKNPSFTIYDDNSYYCFGCGIYGRGAISFIMKQRNLSFIQAVNFLKRMY